MSKTAKIPENPEVTFEQPGFDQKPGVEFSAFDTSRTADQFRAFAEKGVEQSREAYARFKTNAEDAQKALEDTLETAKSVSNEISLKAIAALRANTEANFSHLESLLGARSLADVLELQTTFFRKRVEMSVEQAKELQAVASRAATEVTRPIKDIFDKNVRELKVA